MNLVIRISYPTLLGRFGNGDSLVSGPDVNESGEKFHPLGSKGNEKGSIRFGLAAVSELGTLLVK